MTSKEKVSGVCPFSPIYLFWVRLGGTAALLGQIPSRTESCRGRIRTGLGPGLVRVRQDTSGAAAPPPIPDLGGLGSVVGYVRHGAATAPSRPALLTRSSSCTKNCECFRNEILNKLIRDILFDSTQPEPSPPPSQTWAGRAQRGWGWGRVWRSCSAERTSSDDRTWLRHTELSTFSKRGGGKAYRNKTACRLCGIVGGT